MSDDTDDFLDIPEDMQGVTNKTLPMNMPAAKKKSAKTRSKNMRIPSEVEVPEGADPNDSSWWPHPLPGRDNCGRPRIIETPEEFDRLVDEYLIQCFDRKHRPLMTGLYLHLGFAAGPTSMYDYKERSPAFSQSVTRARQLIKSSYEGKLDKHQGSVQGIIFALKSFANADGENEFNEVNKTELTGKDGQPLSVANLHALESMSEIEKASRLLFLINDVVQKNKEKIIEGDVVDDDEEDYLK